MIQALERAAKILRIVAQSEDGIRLCDLARACELKRNTLYNLADTLVKEGLLSKTDGGKYLIGMLVKELASKQDRYTYLSKIENSLFELHSQYPQSSIYYSEVGDSDIIGKLYFPAGGTGKAVRLETTTLNPYITVCGLVFFAFTPEERMASVRLKNPFEYHGVSAWGNFAGFQEQVESVRRKGYSETPPVTPENDFKVGVPVWRSPGSLTGAITFHMKKLKSVDCAEILADVITAAGKACMSLKSKS